MKKSLVILTLIFSWLLGGCSNSWREGDTGRDPNDIKAMMDEIQGSQGQALSGSDVSTAMANAATAIIYFADAPGDLGPVGSILSFTDFSFLGLQADTWPNIQQARVFYFDSGENVGLVIGIDQGQGFQYYGFSGTATYGDGVMQAELQGSTGTIIVQSDDVSGDTLDDVIQLKFFRGSDNAYIGKISTLVGYN